MSKVSKTFQILNLIMTMVLFLESVMLFSKIDLIPFMLIGLICGIVIIVKNKSDDFFVSEGGIKEISMIITFIVLSIIDIGIMVSFLYIGLDEIAYWVVNILNSEKVLRFILYGVIFPYILSYFVIWFATDSRPMYSITYGITAPSLAGTPFKILFISMLIGLMICVYWEEYYTVAALFISIF